MSIKTSSFDLRINATLMEGSSSYILLGFVQRIWRAVLMEKGNVSATALPSRETPRERDGWGPPEITRRHMPKVGSRRRFPALDRTVE